MLRRSLDEGKTWGAVQLLYGEPATGSAADVLAERHLPVAARRFPRAYPLEPGLWRNLLDDDRAFA